jgi:hypothetical protein
MPETAGMHHGGISLWTRVAASKLFGGVDIQVLYHLLDCRVPNLAHFIDKSKQ